MQEESIDFEEGWDYILNHGFKPLLECLDANRDARKTFPSPDLMTLYFKVYQLCSQKKNPCADKLYVRISEVINKYLKEKALKAVKDVHGQFLLQELVRRWENHKILVEWTKHRCSYIDKYYVHKEELATLGEVGYKAFKDVVFCVISADVRYAVLRQVRLERNGQAIDTSLLRNIKDIFVEMGMDVYKKELEEPFLESTREFYQKESARWAEEYPFHDYMVQAEKSVDAELVRTRAYLHPQTEAIVRQCCESEILKKHQVRMLNKENSGLVVMLEQNQTEDLKRLYRLYKPMSDDALQPIANIYKKHIESVGMELVRSQKSRMESQPDAGRKDSTKSDFECIESLLALHDRYQNLVNECFAESYIFKKAMKDAFEVFVNQQFGHTSTAELFANFSDSLLSQSGHGAKMEEEKLESLLDKLVMLFEHLSEKDVFAEFAQKQLAKRLLMEKSISDGLERSFIQKLKSICGSHYTIKLEGMITDINLSKEYCSKFRDWYKANSDAIRSEDETSTGVVIEGISFSAHVLKSGHWPSYQEEELKLPSPLARCIRTFTTFYDTVTAQRVLRWAHSLGKGSIESTAFEGNPKIPRIEFTVSSHQMCILMLFNEADELSLSEIRNNLIGREGGDTSVKQNLATLCTKKYPLLQKKSTADGDVYVLNKSWGSPRRLIKLPIPSPRVTVEESKAVHVAVEEDRKLAIESAIVRVMKHNKTLEHQQLVVNVSEQLMFVFTPEPRAIKNRIEDLIQREYLQRSPQNPSEYKYLA